MKFLALIILFVQACFADHRGGNGGDFLELALLKRIQNISKFIDKNPSIFGVESGINVESFARNISLQVTTKKLKDKFGSKRCALNFKKKMLIVVNETCILERQFSGRILNALLAHELLNLLGVEPPSLNISHYTFSNKFLNIQEKLVSGDPMPYLVKDCSLRIGNDNEYSKVSLGIIKLKGFKVTQLESSAFTLKNNPLWKSSAALFNSQGRLLWEETRTILDENLIDLPSCLEI